MRQPITNTILAGQHPWCIAGGYAACPALATDCDVWVYGVDDGPFEREKILWRLRSQVAPCIVEFVEESNDTEASTNMYGGDYIYSWKVAQLADGRQIIVTTAESIQEILAAFDVSTHQVALTPDGELIKGYEWTPITVPPVQIRSTRTTPYRMQKITARYGHFVSVSQLQAVEACLPSENLNSPMPDAARLNVTVLP